jgi:hypothetical protein
VLGCDLQAADEPGEVAPANGRGMSTKDQGFLMMAIVAVMELIAIVYLIVKYNV